MAEAGSSGVQNLNLTHCNETNGDRISDLPDAVLCQILSHLTTNDAVGTSLLSSRWRYVWTCVPILRFEENSAVVRDEFVDRVMNLHRLSCIKKFYLSLHKHHDLSHVNDWICAAILHNIEELHLCVNFGVLLKLPQNLYSCEKLVVLKLSHLVLNVPDSVCFPCLKILHFDHVSHLTSEHVEKILSGSPVLEDLSLYDDDRILYEKHSNLSICASSLKKLAICKHTILDRSLYSLDVVAPKLEVLKLNGLWCKAYNMTNLSSLVEADIHVYHCFGELQKQISNVKVLCLTLYFYQGFSEALNHTFLPLDNLTHLDVTPIGDAWYTLPAILRCSPNLEVLVLDAKVSNYYRDIFWFSPEDAPQSMLCLKVIEFKRFEWCQKWMEVFRYFLKDSLVLEKMAISCIKTVSKEQRNSFYKTLLKFPRASSRCQIVFS